MGYYIGSSNQAKTYLQLLEAGLQTKTPAILWGPPGIGKTEFVRALARKHDLKLFVLIASTMDPTDINGLPAIKEIQIEHPDGTVEHATTTEPTLQYWAEALIREGKGILFFDEANNAVPAVQSTLLSVLQGRLVGRHTLPDDVWMIAASNDVKDGADAWELSPPMANRFLHIDFTPNLNDWYEGMLQNWGEEPEPDNRASEAAYLNLQRSRTEVAGFVKQHVDLLHAMPTETSSAGKAWPSPRSWDAVARILAVIPKSEETRGVRMAAVSGLVGEAAAVQYERYEKGLRLPAYENIIADPDSVDWASLSASEVLLVIDMVLANLNETNTKETVDVISCKGVSQYKDIIVSVTTSALRLFSPYMRQNPELLKYFFKNFITSPDKLKLIKDAGLTVS